MVTTDVERALRSSVYAHAAVNPDAVLNTLRYLFFHTRCGIFVSIRDGHVVAFVPFANAAYKNHYGHRIQLTDDALAVTAYAAVKAKSLRKPVERVMEDVNRWWLNGGIMCNVMPRNVWGDEYVASIRDMLDETCIRHTIPDVDFFVNKRDYPQLRSDGGEPYGEFIGQGPLERETYSAYVPVFSFYTGSDMADVPMPTTEDWAAATGRCFPPGSMGPPIFHNKQPTHDASDMRAVFRGTATGRGITPETNVRMRIAVFGAARPDLVDAGVTGYNTRDKVVRAAATTHDPITVNFVAPEHATNRVPFMPMAEQCLTYAYVLYADGHCAASRYGTLMRHAGVILRVASLSPRTCGVLWLFASLVPACVSACGTETAVPLDADHFSIHADLSNLESTVLFLRSHADVAARVLASSRRRAPTVESITTYWDSALNAVHSLTVPAPVLVSCPPTTLPCREWFTPYDVKYARLRTARTSCTGGTTFSSIPP